jgi:hypothetical protein
VFARFGHPGRLWLRPVGESEPYDPTNCCETTDDGLRVTLRCPYVCTFFATEAKEDLPPKVRLLADTCSRATLNIAALRAEEHVYEIDARGTCVVAGPGSKGHFRNNLCKRLAEAFYNLEWIFRNARGEFEYGEFQVYSKLLDELEEFCRDEPAYNLARELCRQTLRLKDEEDLRSSPVVYISNPSPSFPKG